MNTALEAPSVPPEVRRLVQALLENVRAVLGEQLVGLYLEGSLASGNFDPSSDIDFVVVSTGEISPETFLALRAMHERLAEFDPLWGIQLEGFYISRQAIRRYDPPHGSPTAPSLAPLPNLERGEGERLKPVAHDETWAIHRHVLCERGIPIAGPDPRTLIDPVEPDQLRQAVRMMLTGWATQLLEDPALITHRGYQWYIVLTLCRMLYTLETGAVASKPEAARWGQANLAQPWSALVAQAWAGRQGPDQAEPPADLQPTLDFIRYTLEKSL